MRRWWVASAALLLAGCGSGSKQIAVRSPAFAPGRPIPRLYTCDGRDISPPLRWSGVPSGARRLSLVMRDPDAPGGNFIHWRLSGIPATEHELPEGAGGSGYQGPCPPRGEKPHHYVITLSVTAGAKATGTLIGTYARP
jgi:phosphatidylethanolamine-binding protein (PEBP) family uncharacterized protein